MTPQQTQPWAGFSLIESAIILGVVGLIVVGIWIAAGTVNESRRVQETSSFLLRMSQEATAKIPGSVYGGTGSSDASQLLNEMKITPANWQLSATALQDPWGNAVSADVKGDPPAPRVIAIGITHLTKAQCLKLVSAVTSRFRDNTQLVMVEISASDGSDVTSFPADPAGSYCGTDALRTATFNFALANAR